MAIGPVWQLVIDCHDPAAQANFYAALVPEAKRGDVVLEEDGAFQIFLDPEGNEFCLVTGP